MRVGKYVIPGTKLRYASHRFDPETRMTELMICLDDDMQLTQWVEKAADLEKMLKALDSAADSVADLDTAMATGEDVDL